MSFGMNTEGSEWVAENSRPRKSLAGIFLHFEDSGRVQPAVEIKLAALFSAAVGRVGYRAEIQS